MGLTPMRIAVVWPKPRAGRWTLGRTRPAEFPDLSDGLLFLEEHGIEVVIENSCPRWLNPLVSHHEFLSGLDPIRAARVALHARRYDAAICVGDATAYFLLQLKRMFGLTLPVVLIDPALGDGYARRRKLQDFVLPRVDRVIVYGTVQLDYLRQRYGNAVRAVFMHHRADTDFYQPPPPATPRDPLVFSIGNDLSRDFDTLAAAAGIVRSHGVEARFVVQTTLPVNDPDHHLELRRGYIPYSELRDTYRRAAVVVVPLVNSRHAGGINALLEAMASGAPLVTSRSDGIRDYVEDRVTAYLVPPNDAAAMAKAVEQLLVDGMTAKTIAERARGFVADHCANRRYAADLAALLRATV